MRLSKIKTIVFVTSSKADGNMSFVKGNVSSTLDNRTEFLQKHGISLNEIVALQTPHGSSVYFATKKDLGKGAKEAETVISKDALITNQKRVFLFLLTADCLPIAFYDSENKAIAIAHASRHNIQSIITSTISKMEEKLNTKPQYLLVEIGPSIGPCHYQTDLWKITAKQLDSNGVPKSNIYNNKKCTYHAQNQYSHREASEKNLKEDNRQATILGMV